MSAIDEILLSLKDGEWHNLTEITEKVALSQAKVEMAVNFLNEYDFVKLNEKTQVRLQPAILEFIKTIQLIENEEI